MIQDARIGAFVKSLPIPHVPADTTLFPAGPVTIGLEYRVFDPVAEAAKLTPEEITAAGPDSLFGQSFQRCLSGRFRRDSDGSAGYCRDARKELAQIASGLQRVLE